jgi:hypothetical protein
MNRHLTSCCLATVLLAAGCERSPSQRTITYFPDRPIAERLQPGDTHVVVEMKTPAQPAADPAVKPSFEQEIQTMRRGEIIAVVRVTGTAGEIADRGTWVRTTVSADVDRIVKAPPAKPQGESIEFSFAGGTAQIGSVVVSTGKFPQFSEGERYLVVLSTRPGTRSLIWNGVGFRVDSQDTLHRVAINGGGEQPLPTNLAGRNSADVIEALGR